MPQDAIKDSSLSIKNLIGKAVSSTYSPERATSTTSIQKDKMLIVGGCIPRRTTPPLDALIFDRRKRLQVARGLDTAPQVGIISYPNARILSYATSEIILLY